MHFLLKLAYEVHVNVFLNSEFMLPFHVLQVTLAPTDLQPPVSRIVPEPQLDSQEGKIIVFFILICTFCPMNLHIRFLQLSCMG